MECWIKQKERPAKENAGKGGGKGMLNETKGKASKGERWWRRRKWNAEWKEEKASKERRRTLVREEWMECGMK
jgi:hypothetical protein